MSNVYFQQTPGSPYSAWGVMGVTGRILPLKENSLPVLDPYGERNLPVNVSSAWLRRAQLMFLPQSEQVMVANADHHDTGAEKAAARTIIDFPESRVPLASGEQK